MHIQFETFAEFLRTLVTEDQRVRFCEAVRSYLTNSKCSWQYCLHVAAIGRKKPSVALCVAIERASYGAVRCEVLRPDIDWAYLASRSTSPRAAPASPEGAGEARELEPAAFTH